MQVLDIRLDVAVRSKEINPSSINSTKANNGSYNEQNKYIIKFNENQPPDEAILV